MTSPRKLLVGYDYSEGAQAAARAALDLAFYFGGRVDVLTALPQGLDDDTVRELRAAGHPPHEIEPLGFAQFEALARRDLEALNAHDALEIECAACEGDPAPSLLRRAEQRASDMIVVGAVGKGAESSPQPIGTETFRLVRKSEAPVLVVGRDSDWPPTRVLVAVDMSDASRSALQLALTIADECPRARVTALHVTRSAGAVEAVDAFEGFMDAVDAGDLEVERRVLKGRAAKVIPEQAREFDLLAIGSIGRSPVVEFLIGGTAERVLSAFPCSMLFVKATSLEPSPRAS